MKHKQNIHWSRLLRRALALFLATLAAWLLLVCAGAGSAANAFKSLGESSAFVSAALAAELGAEPIQVIGRKFVLYRPSEKNPRIGL